MNTKSFIETIFRNGAFYHKNADGRYYREDRLAMRFFRISKEVYENFKNGKVSK